MRCNVCGEKLIETNECGITIRCNSCEHWCFVGDVYPHLWSEEEQEILEHEVDVGLAILVSREQGGYYLWEMTANHPKYNKLVTKLE